MTHRHGQRNPRERRRGTQAHRTTGVGAGLLAAWPLLTVGCEDSSTGGRRDAGRATDAFVRDFQVALPDRPPPPPPAPDGPVRDAWWPDAGPDAAADATVPERPKYVLGRETALKALKARNRANACVGKVHAQRPLDSLNFAQVNLYQANEPPAPGIYEHNRRLLDCDADPAVDTCEKFLDCIHLVRMETCRGVAFGGVAFCGPDDQYVLCLAATSWGLATDCRASGGTCPEGSGADFGCFYGSCEPGVHGACGDGVRFICDGFQLRPMHCGRETICPYWYAALPDDWNCVRYANPVCEVVPSGDGSPVAVCTGAGPPCDVSELPRCIDDHTVEGCTWPGRLTHLDCDAYWAGSRCVPDGGDDWGAACDLGRECTREPASCVDGKLRMCVGGRWEFLDCEAMGLRCEEAVQGRNTFGCFYPN